MNIDKLRKSYSNKKDLRIKLYSYFRDHQAVFGEMQVRNFEIINLEGVVVYFVSSVMFDRDGRKMKEDCFPPEIVRDNILIKYSQLESVLAIQEDYNTCLLYPMILEIEE